MKYNKSLFIIFVTFLVFLNIGNSIAYQNILDESGLNTTQNIIASGNVTANWGFFTVVQTVSLTASGSAIINGLITSQNIVPALDSLYSLGNSTNWFKDIFVKNVYASSINTTNLTSVNINSQNLNSTSIDTTTIDFGSGTINRSGDDFLITLT